MVITEHNSSERRGRIILQPNRSLTWRANLYFFLVLSILSLSVAIFFTLQGAWLILLFSIVELIGVLAGLYYCVKRCYRQEVITFSSSDIWIEKGIIKPQYTWHYPRLWAKICVKKAAHPWDGPSIFLRSHGMEIELGEFLNKNDKDQLVKQLENMIYVWLPQYENIN